MKTFLTILSVVLLGSSLSFAKPAKLPKWFDLKAHQELIQAKGQAEGMSHKVVLKPEEVKVKNFKIGKHKLTLLTAKFVGEDPKSSWSYHLSELYNDNPKNREALVQIIEESSCDTKVIQNATIKKLGKLNKSQIFFAGLKLAKPTCVGSEKDVPEEYFVLLRENKKGVKKIYESEILEQKNYKVKLENKKLIINFLNDGSEINKSIIFNWDKKEQDFIEQVDP